MDFGQKSLGELKDHWEACKQEADAMLVHIDALLGLAARVPDQKVDRTDDSATRSTRKAKPSSRRGTSKDRIDELLPELPEPMSQAAMMRWLKGKEIRVSRQTMSMACRELVDEGKLAKRKSPEGELAPFVYGRPDMFESEEKPDGPDSDGENLSAISMN